MVDDDANWYHDDRRTTVSERVVLAYSGGLDTSVAIEWIKEETGAEVIAVAADVGQGGEDLEVIRERALACGAVEAEVADARDEFELGGDLRLQAQNYPSNLDDKVGGNLNITQVNATEEQYAGAAGGFSSVLSFIIGLLAALVLGLVLIYFFPGFVRGVADLVKDSPLKTALLGFLALIFLPVLAVILLITIFGWSLSVLIILLLALAVLIATIPVKLLAGELVYNKILKKETGEIAYYLVGAVIFAILYEIPIVGWLIGFIALIIGLGAIIAWLAIRARATG